ncbi:MAG: flagellin [Phycisphaerae bacterium]|nr:flagellin [Phycisphaerae bacterium]
MTRINTNIPSIIAQGRMRNNLLDQNTRLERLSTGLRINRGADDPAGLIASETLRSEISGIAQAMANSERAINMLATAEGALNEISALLLHIKGLVVEMANEGGLGDEEVAADQLEIDSILSSIDRISNTSQFSGKKLLNGSLDYTLSNVDTNCLASVQVYGARIPESSTKSVVVQVTNSAETATLGFDNADKATSAVTIELAGQSGTEILSFVSGTTFAQIITAANDLTTATGVSASLSGTALRFDSTGYGSDAYVSVKSINGIFVQGAQQVDSGATSTDYGVDPSVLVNGQQASTNGLRIDSRTATLDGRLYLDSDFAQSATTTTFRITGGGSLFQLGPEVSPLGQVHVGLQSVSTANLGNAVVGFLNTIKTGGTCAVDQGNYIVAEDIVNQAINQIAVFRGRLGNLEKNQIRTNINSQQIALENVTSAESVIRDADVAVEVSAMTRAQILVQATQLTLSVANQQPQLALQLLG